MSTDTAPPFRTATLSVQVGQADAEVINMLSQLMAEYGSRLAPHQRNAVAMWFFQTYGVSSCFLPPPN